MPDAAHNADRQNKFTVDEQLNRRIEYFGTTGVVCGIRVGVFRDKEPVEFYAVTFTQ